MAGIDWHAVFFWLAALATCGFAVAVTLSANIVRMAFYLVLSLGSTALLFFLAGADFVGAMQLMIYVGGTLVLLAFGVMLTARGSAIKLAPTGGSWVLGAIVGAALLAVLLQVAFSVPAWRNASVADHAANAAPAPTAAPIGMALLGVRTDQLAEPNAANRGGMSGYLLAFEIVSVHLVVVLVGAAYLVRTRRRPGRPETP